MSTPPILGFAAWSGTGKTTLLKKLIPMLRSRGLRLGIVKHAHHAFDVDQPGKDSYELRHAGAERVLVGSRRRWALMVESEQDEEPTLQQLLAQMPGDSLDLILVEGFKHERFDKIEIHRASRGAPLLHPDDDSIIAVASDEVLDPAPRVTQLDLDDLEGLVRFITHHTGVGKQ